MDIGFSGDMGQLSRAGKTAGGQRDGHIPVPPHLHRCIGSFMCPERIAKIRLRSQAPTRAVMLVSCKFDPIQRSQAQSVIQH